MASNLWAWSGRTEPTRRGRISSLFLRGLHEWWNCKTQWKPWLLEHKLSWDVRQPILYQTVSLDLEFVSQFHDHVRVLGRSHVWTPTNNSCQIRNHSKTVQASISDCKPFWQETLQRRACGKLWESFSNCAKEMVRTESILLTSGKHPTSKFFCNMLALSGLSLW